MIVHTYPVGDLIEHDVEGGPCDCNPVSETVPNRNGEDGLHVIHNALDGRD